MTPPNYRYSPHQETPPPQLVESDFKVGDVLLAKTKEIIGKPMLFIASAARDSNYRLEWRSVGGALSYHFDELINPRIIDDVKETE